MPQSYFSLKRKHQKSPNRKPNKIRKMSPSLKKVSPEDWCEAKRIQVEDTGSLFKCNACNMEFLDVIESACEKECSRKQMYIKAPTEIIYARRNVSNPKCRKPKVEKTATLKQRQLLSQCNKMREFTKYHRKIRLESPVNMFRLLANDYGNTWFREIKAKTDQIQRDKMETTLRIKQREKVNNGAWRSKRGACGKNTGVKKRSLLACGSKGGLRNKGGTCGSNKRAKSFE
ncbi:hypothetical protein WDU94_013059 [Cyamophila willieti]